VDTVDSILPKSLTLDFVLIDTERM